MVTKTPIKEPLEKVFRPLGDEGWKEGKEFQFDGQEVASDFRLQFLGTDWIADKEKRPLWAPCFHPEGNKSEGYNAYHGVSPVGEKSELFIKRDTNGRKEKTQKEARMLRELLRLDYKEALFFGPFPQQIKISFKKGFFSKDKENLVRLDVHFETITFISGNIPMAKRPGVNYLEVSMNFREADRAGLRPSILAPV